MAGGRRTEARFSDSRLRLQAEVELGWVLHRIRTKATGSPSLGSRLGATETSVKAVPHRRTPPSWRLFPDAHNPPEPGRSAPGRPDECLGLSYPQFPVPAEPLAWNQSEIANCHFGSSQRPIRCGEEKHFYLIKLRKLPTGWNRKCQHFFNGRSLHREVLRLARLNNLHAQRFCLALYQ